MPSCTLRRLHVAASHDEDEINNDVDFALDHSQRVNSACGSLALFFKCRGWQLLGRSDVS